MEQTDISQFVDASLERYNLEPSAPGMQLEISHLDKELQKQINALCTTYKDAFATRKYDICLFLGFSADIDTNEGKTSCERERNLKPHVIKEIEPIMQKIIKEGVFAPADKPETHFGPKEC